MADRVWKHLAENFGIPLFTHQSIQIRLHWWWNRPIPPTVSSTQFRLTPIFFLWQIWKIRNEARFDNVPIHFHSIIQRAKWWIRSLFHSPSSSPPRASPGLMPTSINVPSTDLVVKWIRPVEGTFKLNVDGSALTKPGPAGGGGVCRNSNGVVIFAFYSGYGVASNNMAEVRAMCEGMKVCVNLRIDKVAVESDSKWLIECILGKSTPAWNWRHWLERIKTLASRGSFTFSHIPREVNGPADGLAKEGCSKQSHQNSDESSSASERKFISGQSWDWFY